MIRIAAAFLLSAASVAASAQDAGAGAAPATPDQAAEETDDDREIVVESERPKRVCETLRDTGSIMPRRVCRTAEQVAADAARAEVIKDTISRDRQTREHVQASRGTR